MKKYIIKFLFFLLLILSSQSSFAYDMENGVWKNLNEEYEQTINNKKLVSGMLFNRLDYSDNFDSNNKNNEYNNAYLRSRLGFNFNLINGFSLKTLVKLEDFSNLKSSPDGSNRFFEYEGLFLDELVLGYEYNNFSILAGKFNPNFGDAWKIKNGVWINEIAKNYAQIEKLGFGLIKRVGDKKTIGEYVFGASVFKNDRKYLDNSTVTKRDSDAKSDGKPGDDGLNSFVLSTDIYYNFSGKEKLSYHFAYLNLGVNDRQNHSNIPAKIDNENGFVLNMNYQYPFNADFLLDGFVEYAIFDNLNGNTEKDSNFLTLNLTAYIFDDYYVTLASARQRQSEVDANGFYRTAKEVSLGYKFDNLNPALKGLSAAVAYEAIDIDNKTSKARDDSFGLMVRHKMEF